MKKRYLFITAIASVALLMFLIQRSRTSTPHASITPEAARPLIVERRDQLRQMSERFERVHSKAFSDYLQINAEGTSVTTEQARTVFRNSPCKAAADRRDTTFTEAAARIGEFRKLRDQASCTLSERCVLDPAEVTPIDHVLESMQSALSRSESALGEYLDASKALSACL